MRENIIPYETKRYASINQYSKCNMLMKNAEQNGPEEQRTDNYWSYVSRNGIKNGYQKIAKNLTTKKQNDERTYEQCRDHVIYSLARTVHKAAIRVN